MNAPFAKFHVMYVCQNCEAVLVDSDSVKIIIATIKDTF